MLNQGQMMLGQAGTAQQPTSEPKNRFLSIYPYWKEKNSAQFLHYIQLGLHKTGESEKCNKGLLSWRLGFQE